MQAAFQIAWKDIRQRVRDRSVFIWGIIAPVGLAAIFSLLHLDDISAHNFLAGQGQRGKVRLRQNASLGHRLIQEPGVTTAPDIRKGSAIDQSLQIVVSDQIERDRHLRCFPHQLESMLVSIVGHGHPQHLSRLE